MSDDDTPNQDGEVDYTHQLSDNMGELYLNEEYSDVTFIVESEKFHAHKMILATRSDYFRALLFGGMHESQQNTIELKEVKVAAFLNILKYIYTGRVALNGLKVEAILDVLTLSHHYNIVDLETSTSNYLKSIISVENVCAIYNATYLYQPCSLVDECLVFMDRHALEIVQHESFLLLSAAALKFVISRSSFYAPEIDIFCSVLKWKKQNNPEDCGNSDIIDTILNAIRFPLICIDDLLDIVRPSKPLSPDAVLDVIKVQRKCKNVDLNHRRILMPEVNVATPNHHSVVLHGEAKAALLNGNTERYDTYHSIKYHGGDGILIKLGLPCSINHIKMFLLDYDERSYMYYIEASLDMKDWTCLVDHREYMCRSWQRLYFPAQVVRYIRIIGTRNTDTGNSNFRVFRFSCMFTMDHFSVDNGLVVPRVNVADESRSAVVIEELSIKNKSTLLNGDTEQYDDQSAHTRHEIGSKPIVIQLAQPYAIDSMRLLLWDIDDRTYSYYIDVSTDNIKWETVVDKSDEFCK
ncbi:BTBD9 (predicted) [Pycnogonum litorale]